jgi:type II secretory pathway pseudopilin PulG
MNAHPRHRREHGPHLRDEGGFTLVEALIGALLLVIGALSVMQLLDIGTRNVYRTEESQVVNNLLQAELEEMRQLPYAQVALTEPPEKVPDRNDPRWRVEGDRYATGRDGGGLERLVFNGGTTPAGDPVTEGAVEPMSEPVTVGDVQVRIFRFVTWTHDPNCNECGAGVMKRLIVAAKVVRAPVSAEREFQELQTTLTDPTITPEDNPAPPTDDPGTATLQLWLTDTTCDHAARIQTTEDHRAHNTLSTCEAGEQVGETPGAPDLLSPRPPQLVDNPGLNLFDYATDAAAEPVEGADEDIGLLLPNGPIDECPVSPNDVPTDDPDAHLWRHYWVSPPIANAGAELTGRGALELYTQTINGATHAGELCAWLSVREPPGEPGGVAIDHHVVNVGSLGEGECREGLGLNQPSFQFVRVPWPKSWEKVTMALCFVSVNEEGEIVPTSLEPGSRIVLTVMVAPEDTRPGQGLELMYDQIGFESRLELETNKVLAFD